MAAVYPTTVLFEMVLTIPLTDETGALLTDEAGRILTADGWANVSADVLTEPGVTWSRGNGGRTVFDRVANVGTLTLVLNNSEFNDAELAGYYSPDHSNVNSRFGLDTPVRLTITENSVVHPEWYGTITRIEPESNQSGTKRTRITAEDWMAHAYRDKVRGITVQTSKRDDQALTSLLALASISPLATDFSTGDDTYAYIFHDENSLASTLGRVFQKLMMSGFGRLYLTGYETLTYRTRSDLLLSGTPAATFDDTMHGLKLTRNKSQRVKEVQVTTYPVELDGSAAILWNSPRERELAAGESVEFDMSLRDPSGRATRVAALSAVTPVADTDYKLSSVSGSGNDLNANLTISTELKADLVTASLTNTAGVTGYLWLHQQRGIGAYLYEPVTITAATGQLDGETIDIDMVYQDDPNVGQDILDLLTYWHVVDQSDIESLSFVANQNQTLMDAAFLACGELVSVTETQTGVNTGFLINGWSKTLKNGSILQVTWNLIPANQITGVCRLDVVGLAELDSTAILGA